MEQPAHKNIYLYKEVLCNFILKYYEKADIKEIYIHICPKNKLKYNK